MRRAVTVANEAYGIEAGRSVSLLIVYPHFDVDGVCSYTFKSGRCPKKYRGFPFFGLADRERRLRDGVTRYVTRAPHAGAAPFSV